MSQKQPSQVVPANADGLTPEQIGEGWRLARHDEKPHLKAQVWRTITQKWWPRSWHMVRRPYEPGVTYRVPVEEGGAR